MVNITGDVKNIDMIHTVGTKGTKVAVIEKSTDQAVDTIAKAAIVVTSVMKAEKDQLKSR